MRICPKQGLNFPTQGYGCTIVVIKYGFIALSIPRTETFAFLQTTF